MQTMFLCWWAIRFSRFRGRFSSAKIATISLPLVSVLMGRWLSIAILRPNRNYQAK
jgi:hypothetical protein